MDIRLILIIVIFVMSFTMIVFGLLFDKHVPRNINFVLGYRSPRSMKNQDTWTFANVYAGRRLWITGVILLISSLIAILLTLNSDISVMRTVGIVIIIVHAIMIFGVAIATEITLRKNFDKQGNRK